MGRIAQQEYAAFAKRVRNAVMHMVGRKPVDALDGNAHTLQQALAHVFPGEGPRGTRRVLAHRTDEAGATFALERKRTKKIHVVQRHVQLLVRHRAAGLNVGHVEDVRVSPAGEAGAQDFAHLGMRAIATGEIAARACVFGPICTAQRC